MCVDKGLGDEHRLPEEEDYFACYSGSLITLVILLLSGDLLSSFMLPT